MTKSDRTHMKRWLKRAGVGLLGLGALAGLAEVGCRVASTGVPGKAAEQAARYHWAAASVTT